ncbi:MAG: hypothetical protein NC184_02465 [Roseburia sp.]|nr:hypothetical protein [Roseburia sp.]
MSIFDTVKRGMAVAGAEVFSIGESACGLPLLGAHCGGHTGRQIIVTAAIHARECYTALVVLRQIERAARALAQGDGAYFVPLVNPDGALFFESGDTLGSPTLERFQSSNKLWKANADGIDLNCNFDANWGSGKQNKTVVGASDYIGERPFCAPESAALAAFTRRIMPAFTVSYHCMGGELYWEFFQSAEDRARDMALADAIAKRIGVKRVDGDLSSAGGYKDWCVQKLHIPSVTVELLSSGEHPFRADNFSEACAVNERLPEFILDMLRK